MLVLIDLGQAIVDDASALFFVFIGACVVVGVGWMVTLIIIDHIRYPRDY